MAPCQLAQQPLRAHARGTLEIPPPRITTTLADGGMALMGGLSNLTVKVSGAPLAATPLHRMVRRNCRIEETDF